MGVITISIDNETEKDESVCKLVKLLEEGIKMGKLKTMRADWHER